VEPDDRHERRRLAGAVRAEERDDLSLANAEVDLSDGDDRPVARREAPDL